MKELTRCSQNEVSEAQADANITHLIQDFNSQLRIQNEQVEELIRKEKKEYVWN